MKRLIFLLLVFIPLLVGAQTYDHTFESSDSYLVTDYTGFAGDTIGEGDSTWTYTVQHYQPYKVFYDFYLDIDSIGGTANETSILYQSRLSSVDDWSTIDSTVWTGTVDTTVHYTETSTSTAHKDFRILVRGEADTFTAEIQRFFLRLLRD